MRGARAYYLGRVSSVYACGRYCVCDTVGTQTTDVSRGDYSCSGEFLPELFSFLMTAPELKRIRLAFLGGALVALCFMLVTEEDED